MTNGGGSGGGGGGGAARRWFQEYLNVFLGYAGLLLAVFFVAASWPVRLAILAIAGALAWVTVEVVGGRVLTRAVASRLVLAVLAVAALAVVLVGATNGSDAPRDGADPPATPSDCPSEAGDLAPGERDVEAAAYRDAFHAAYEEAGGREEVGCPVNLVDFTFGAGVHQNFDRSGVLLAVDPDAVVWVEPSVATCVDRAAGAPGDVFRNTAYPREGPRELEGGWVLVLGHSRSGPARPNAVVRREDGDLCAWVTHEFWLAYDALGGPEGELGYPTGNDGRNPAGVEEQRFEHGCLARHGAEVVVAPCGAPAPAASRSMPPRARRHRLADEVATPAGRIRVRSPGGLPGPR